MKSKLKLVRGGPEIVYSEQLDTHIRVVIQKAAGDLVDYLMFKDGVRCDPLPLECGITLNDALLQLQGARCSAEGTRGREFRGPGIRVHLSAGGLFPAPPAAGSSGSGAPTAPGRPALAAAHEDKAVTGRRQAVQARIDTAVGAIRRLLRGLPLDSLELVRDLVGEALQAAKARARGARRTRSIAAGK